MEKQTWKVALAGGIVTAAGLGGFAVAGADSDRARVDSVELDRATLDASAVDSALASPASTVTTVTAAPAPPVPATVAPPVVAFGDSVDRANDSVGTLAPPPPPAPAPAPVFDDSASVASVAGADSADATG